VWPVNASQFVICAGGFSGHVANLAGIGCGGGILSIPLPVEPRKRYVYVVHVPEGAPGLDCPLLVDPSGAWMRREGYGGHYLVGRSPPDDVPEPPIDDMEVDETFFADHVWPQMAARVPAFENLKVKSSWAGFYDYNTWDQNAIVGRHPYHQNVFFATGFSGHGIQQAPAIGRAIMELMFDGDFQTLDLTRLGFDRILLNEKCKEACVI